MEEFKPKLAEKREFEEGDFSKSIWIFGISGISASDTKIKIYLFSVDSPLLFLSSKKVLLETLIEWFTFVVLEKHEFENLNLIFDNKFGIFS